MSLAHVKLSKINSISYLKHIKVNYALSYDEIHRQHGENVTLDFFQKLFITKNPELIREILKDNFTLCRRSKLFAAYFPLLGQGILTRDTEGWRGSRQAIVEAINSTDKTNRHSIIQKVLAHYSYPEDEEHNTLSFSHDLIMEIIGNLFFNKIFIKHKKEIKNIFDHASSFFSKKQKKLIKPFFFTSNEEKEVMAKIQRFRSIVGEIIADPIQSPFLKSLAARCHGSELIDQTMNIILAGYETSAITLSWCIYYLGLYPEWQEKMRKELPDQNKHINNFINEIVRLYPPVGVILRRAHKDIAYKELVIPSGSEIVCNLFSMQRDPSLWENSTEFQPDRFNIHQPHYMPFGFGPTLCPGRETALQEIQLILLYLVQNYHIEVVSGAKTFTTQAMLKPDTPLICRFIKRD